jgi:ribosomal protein S18 acetylase RimI-like enzyme
MEHELAGDSYRFAQLHVLETNHRARSLYERLGWTLVRDGDPHPEGPQAVYEKSFAE